MKICVAGAGGQLGRELYSLGKQIGGFEILPLNRSKLDITDRDAVYRILSEARPDALINCAAYNAVDRAEGDRDTCWQVNACGSRYIAEVCEAVGTRLVHLSTDYVFDGAKKLPYEENDIPSPLQVYGQTKHEGEKLVLESCKRVILIRTSWLYSGNGTNFLKTILRKSSEVPAFSVVSDQIGSPTCTSDLAEAIFSLIKCRAEGIIHFSGEGACSWFDFASAIVQAYGLDCEIIPCTSAEFPAAAKRPGYSYLSHRHFMEISGRYPKHWREALAEFVKNNPLPIGGKQ